MVFVVTLIQMEAFNVRDNFCSYFNTNGGIPWREKFIS